MSEQRTHPQMNEGNARELAEAIARVGPFTRQCGAELGSRIAAGLRAVANRRDVEW